MRFKYGNKKVQTAEGTFDSRKEFNRYGELKLLEKAGEITDLQRQVKFQLQSCFYLADFTYRIKDMLIVEDVKSEITKRLPMYRLKKRMMKDMLGISIKET